jgi:hypothetical protein
MPSRQSQSKMVASTNLLLDRAAWNGAIRWEHQVKSKEALNDAQLRCLPAASSISTATDNHGHHVGYLSCGKPQQLSISLCVSEQDITLR